MSMWARVAARRLRGAPTKLLWETSPFGYQPLREAVADHLQLARGVRCSWEQVAIVTGVQEALDLAARIFLQPGDRVCVEDPGYVGATRLLEAYGARITGMSVDSEGAVVPRGSVRDVRLAYVTPAHQFPLGVTMSIARRLALLDWARRTDALIFEDDYDSEYRYSGRPIPALQGLDTRGSVIFAGTFSKVLFPSLRLGYLVVPSDLVERIAAVKSLSTRHAPVLEQAILCDFMVEGHFMRHLRRMREVYAERVSVLLDYGRERLGGLLDISPVEAGLQTVGWLPGTVSDVRAAREAAQFDVEVVPLSIYSRKRLEREGLQLGFAAVDPPELRRGVEDLERVLTALTRNTSITPGARRNSTKSRRPRDA
jgi:GntR family transcriptional regulator/MocR family aminotransferase